MRSRMILITLVTLVTTAAISCSASTEAQLPEVSPVVSCTMENTSNVEGVHLRYTGPGCVFSLAEAAEGITFTYEVVVDGTVEGIVPEAIDEGGCGRPDGSGLITYHYLTGGDQGYSELATGLCPPYDATPQTLRPGTWTYSFRWTGRNWTGASDYSNPMGESFPPGEYQVGASAVGTRILSDGSRVPFDVRTQMTFVLTP